MNNIYIYTTLLANYGSMLQAYALQQKLSESGFKAELANKLKPASIVEKLKAKAIIYARLFFTLVRYPKKLKLYINFKKNKAIVNCNTNELSETTTVFQSQHLLINPVECLNSKKIANCYDAFIAGSDQIWKGGILLADKNAFLRFAPKNKRIAYAPSIGGVIMDFNERAYGRYIKDIPYLSVRETLGASEIKRITGREAVVALDPTLLVTSEFWEQRMVLPAESGYILCYFLNEPSPLAVKHLEFLKDKYGLKVLSILSTNAINDDMGVQALKPTPFEFLGLFNNARFVLTDSFHGCAFSIVFNKSFFVYKRNYALTYDESSRVDSILGLLELNDRLVHGENFIDLSDNIDYTKVTPLLEERRKISADFLESSLKAVKENNG